VVWGESCAAIDGCSAAISPISFIKTAAARPEFLGFSASWELDYVNILATLEKLDIPLSRDLRIPSDDGVRNDGESWNRLLNSLMVLLGDYEGFAGAND
jgi:hypothetical protein